MSLPLLIDITHASAQDVSGPYMSGGIGVSYWSESTTECARPYDGDVLCPKSGDRQTGAGRLGGGWRFNRYFEVEAAYAIFSNIDVEKTGTFCAVNFNGPCLSVKGWSEEGKYTLQGVDFSAILSMPLDDRFFLTGRAGGFAYHQSYTFTFAQTRTHDGVAPLYGVGLAYQLDPANALCTEVTRIQGVAAFPGFGGEPDGRHFDIDLVWVTLRHLF